MHVWNQTEVPCWIRAMNTNFISLTYVTRRLRTWMHKHRPWQPSFMISHCIANILRSCHSNRAINIRSRNRMFESIVHGAKFSLYHIFALKFIKIFWPTFSKYEYKASSVCKKIHFIGANKFKIWLNVENTKAKIANHLM